MRTLFVIAALCQMSCSDDEEKIDKEEIGADNITLEFVSEEISSGSVAVENFLLLSVEEKESDGKQFYDFKYSFEIHNNGSQPLELNDWTIQNYLILDPLHHAASGSLIYATTIAPGGKYVLSYSANSTQLEDGFAVDGMILQIQVRQDSDPFITLEYLIHVKD